MPFILRAALLAGVVLACVAGRAPAADAPAAQQIDKKAPKQNASPEKKAGGADAGAQPGGSAADKAGPAMTLAKLKDMAAQRAQRDYQPPSGIPKRLQQIPHRRYKRIDYKSKRALWADTALGYRVMGYLPGSYYAHAVAIDVVTGDNSRAFAFSKDRFTYPKPALADKVPDDLGYAGFKVLHELATPGKLDEVVSFLGASYFRALGAGEHYGLSARGLAINTAEQSGETFPNFVHFWIVRPQVGQRTLTLYALLAAPEVTGAYRFDVTPGEATYIHVDATLYTRQQIDKLGIAPLTSMFTWGENSLIRTDNYRPEAHDSDGLLVHTRRGEWVWQPLVNPQKLAIADVMANDVQGFGLLQRDRSFDHYLSLSKAYQARPNLWITPDSDWGKGRIELVQIPSDSEVNDNIEAAWVPKQPVKAGQTLHFAYTMKWSDEPVEPPTVGRVTDSYVGLAAAPQGESANNVRIALEFAGGSLNSGTNVVPQITTLRQIDIKNVRLEPNPHADGWRLSFMLGRKALSTPLEMHVYLKNADGEPVTETWRYQLQAP